MLTFHFNPDIQGFSLAFTPRFFNTLQFQENQLHTPLFSFYILDVTEKKILGSIFFTRVGDSAFSQPNGPFGGFELDATIDEETFVSFHAFFESELKKIGISKIKIVEPPDIMMNDISYEPLEKLLELNYSIVVSEINHFINLDDVTDAGQIHQMERRNFRKALAKGYKWKLESADALPEVYSFIERCRHQNKLLINITYEDIDKSFRRFPGRYRIFSIRHNGYLAAVTITVEVNENILYNYLPASDKKYSTDSPMVFLLVNLYKYAKSLGYQVLDLGVSSVNGKVQTGLAEFKERMGALFCEKRTLEKKLG